MRHFKVILMEDEKDGGYTVFSEEIDQMVGGGIVAQGDTIDDALHSYANIYHDVIKHNDFK